MTEKIYEDCMPVFRLKPNSYSNSSVVKLVAYMDKNDKIGDELVEFETSEENIKKYFGDKAIRVTDAWSIMSTQKKNNNGCGNGSSGLQGIVSTNAAVYDPGAPTADTTNRTLNYRVASPINDPSGKPIPGQYAISMSETIAQCLYNVKSIPSQAQLIITDKNGTQVVQTAAIKTQDGWINFAANNFDFSDLSLLQVKLGADATAKPASTTTSSTATPPTPTKPTSKVTTITCIKGKLKKSVSGVNPTCPAGYKKS